MTPTQAQIDAARRVMDDEHIMMHKGIRSTSIPDALIAKILTAAAEAGPEKTPAWQNAEKECKEIEDRTIDRCAEVADEWASGRFKEEIDAAEAIAAAIRALKDKP
jgi:hypothetical protein